MPAGATLEFTSRDLVAAADEDTDEAELVLAVHTPPKHGVLELLDVSSAPPSPAAAAAATSETSRRRSATVPLSSVRAARVWLR